MNKRKTCGTCKKMINIWRGTLNSILCEEPKKMISVLEFLKVYPSRWACKYYEEEEEEEKEEGFGSALAGYKRKG